MATVYHGDYSYETLGYQNGKYSHFQQRLIFEDLPLFDLNVRESKVLVNSIACFEAVIVCLLVSCNGSYLSSTEKLKSNETPFLASHGGI